MGEEKEEKAPQVDLEQLTSQHWLRLGMQTDSRTRSRRAWRWRDQGVEQADIKNAHQSSTWGTNEFFRFT